MRRPATEIVPGVHRLAATWWSHAYLVLGDQPLLVDTGLPGLAPGIVAELGRLGLAPGDLAHIVLTHHDVDHVGNAERLRSWSGAELWAPVEDVPYIHGDRRRPGYRALADAVLRPEKPRIGRTYGPGQRIGDLEVIACPGHTPGHVAFRFRDTLFAGDLVQTVRGRVAPLTFGAWDRAVLARSMREVGRLGFDWVCPAHGDPVRRGQSWP